MADAAVRYVCRALGWLRCCSVSASGGVVVTVNIFPDIPALQREAAVPSATPTVPPSALGRCESNVAKSAEGGTASYPAVCRAHSQCERMDGCCVASCWLRWRVPSAAAIFVDRTAEAPSSPVLHRPVQPTSQVLCQQLPTVTLAALHPSLRFVDWFLCSSSARVAGCRSRHSPAGS